MSADGSATLARLCCWVPPDRLKAFESAYEQRLVPVLKRHGLVESSECGRPTVAGVFNRLFAVERPVEVEVKARALGRDPAWQAARQELGQALGSTEPDGQLRYSFHLYRTPAGPGRTVEVGPGVRQGRWQRFEFQDGLPTYVIPAIRQDRQGDLWLAAHSYGLCRYDGAQATTFGVEDGLVGIGVFSMLGDRQDRWWVGTVEGVSCYDGQAFAIYTAADGLAAGMVWALLEDRQGRLWVGADGGLSRYDGESFVTFTACEGLVDNRVYALLEDRQGLLWIGTHGGLNRYDGESFVTVSPDGDRACGMVHALLEDREGRVWVGTQGGLSRCDGQDWVTYTAAEGLSPSPILCLVEDREGDVWLGSHGGGVSRYDGTLFVQFTVEDGLANNQVYSLLEDETVDLWAGTWNGVNRYCRTQFAHFTTRDGLSHHAVLSIAEDRQGHLWFGTFDGGVERYDGAAFTHFQLPRSGNVNAIQEDCRGDLWFGCELALFRYDGREFVRETEEATPDEGSWVLLADRQGRVWVGTRHRSAKANLRRCDG